jgi:rhodanese-related sulfurtransferase
MKKINIVSIANAIIVSVAILFSGCSNSNENQQSLNIQELQKNNKNEQKFFKIDSLTLTNPNSEYQFIDLRTEDRFIVSHIKNAIYIPLHKALDKENIELYKTKKTVFVCSNGITSDQIWMLLTQAGLKNIYTLQGGFKNIVQKNYTDLNDEKPAYDFKSVVSETSSNSAETSTNSTTTTAPKSAKKKKKGASGGCS